MDPTFTSHYSFGYQSSANDNSSFPISSSQTKNIAVSDNSSWRVTLREFTDFLSGIYGYNITEQVFVEDLTWEGESTYISLRDADIV